LPAFAGVLAAVPPPAVVPTPSGPPLTLLSVPAGEHDHAATLAPKAALRITDRRDSAALDHRFMGAPDLRAHALVQRLLALCPLPPKKVGIFTLR
jgi:hypothetical protein